MKPMVYIITSLSVGGAQKALLNLTSSTFSRDYPPVVISLIQTDGLQEQFAQAGVPVYEMAINKLSHLLLLPWRLWSLIKYLQPQVIHGWMHHGNIVAVLAWLFAGFKPTLLWGIHHTPEKATTERWQHALVLTLGRWLSCLPAATLYVSRRSLERHRELNYDMSGAQVIVNGITINKKVDGDEEKAQLKVELGIPSDCAVIGSLTRFVPEKDIPNLLDAIRICKQHREQVFFILAGEGMDANNPQLQTLITQSGCGDVVRLLGVRRDTEHLLNIMDIATLSSCREALPLFLVEAMAAGVPCVATDVGDIAECIGKTGVVVPKQNPNRLAAAWARILALSPGERQQLGQQAQAQIKQHYSLDAVVEQYRKLLAILATKTVPIVTSYHVK